MKNRRNISFAVSEINKIQSNKQEKNERKKYSDPLESFIHI